jgi:hypothetical protein
VSAPATKQCPKCRGARRIPAAPGSNWLGFKPCPFCDGSGIVPVESAPVTEVE